MKTEDSDTPKSYGRVRCGTGILLVGLTLLGTLLTLINRPHPPPLLDRASTVLAFEPTYGWRYVGLNDSAPVIATLSDTNWFVGRWDLTQKPVIPYWIDQVGFNPTRRSANMRLSSILNQDSVLVGDLEPSPDGRWVIGTLLNGSEPEPDASVRRVVVALDGSRVIQWPAILPKYVHPSRSVNGSYIAWMPGSRNVAEMVADQSFEDTFQLQGTLHDVSSGRTSTLRFSGTGRPERGAQLAIRPDVLFLSSISNVDQACTSPMRRLLRMDLGRTTVKTMALDLYTWSLLQPDAAPKISHLDTPSGTWLVGLAFSPDGKHLAWEVVRDNHSSPIERLLCWLSSRPVPASSEQIEVWTSGIDGSRMEMIGYLPPTEHWDEEYRGTQLHLAWLPSGKALRFAYKDKIYTVKAD